MTRPCIVIVAGSSLGTPGTLNGIVIHTVGEVWKVTMEKEPISLASEKA